MNEDNLVEDFIVKFNELNKYNQKYVIAIQQALIYAQTTEEFEDDKIVRKKQVTQHTKDMPGQISMQNLM